MRIIFEIIRIFVKCKKKKNRVFVNSAAVATGWEKVSFHSNPKEKHCQRMLKLPHNCTHLTC